MVNPPSTRGAPEKAGQPLLETGEDTHELRRVDLVTADNLGILRGLLPTEGI